MEVYKKETRRMNEETIVEVDMNAILIEALKELNLKVEALRARVEQLENRPIQPIVVSPMDPYAPPYKVTC